MPKTDHFVRRRPLCSMDALAIWTDHWQWLRSGNPLIGSALLQTRRIAPHSPEQPIPPQVPSPRRMLSLVPMVSLPAAESVQKADGHLARFGMPLAQHG